MPDHDVDKTIAPRRELLRFVLRDTLKDTGIPAAWLGGEAVPTVDEAGKLWVEVRLILKCHEPRFLYYLAAFQAEFERRLIAMDPQLWDWASRISWSLPVREADDPDFSLPNAEYWDDVLRDREVTARQEGRKDWDRASLARHFEDTDPGHADFENTHPPERDEGELHPSKF
jgi:hypothetical protein